MNRVYDTQEFLDLFGEIGSIPRCVAVRYAYDTQKDRFTREDIEAVQKIVNER